MEEEKAKWQQEMDKKLAEEREFWTKKFESEMAKLTAQMTGQEVPVQIATVETPSCDHASGQGSCPRSQEGNKVVELGQNGVKKKLNLEIVKDNPNIQACDDLVGEPNQTTLEEEVENIISPRTSVIAKNGDIECGLAIGTKLNVVAFGVVLHTDVEPSMQLVHGIPLGEDNLRVSVKESFNDRALIPIPVRDDITIVIEALNSVVAWPRELVIIPRPTEVLPCAFRTDSPPAKKPRILPSVQEKKKHCSKRGIPKKRAVDFDYEGENLEILPTKLPLPLRDLCVWANKALRDNCSINNTIGPELFGHSRKVSIYRNDVYNVAHNLELSEDSLVCYLSYLHGVLQNSHMLDMVAFIDPGRTGALGCGNPTERAKYLSSRYKQGKADQIFVVPHNNSAHWVLTVVCPTDNSVYMLDPLKKLPFDDEWKMVLNHSLMMFYAPKYKKASRRETKWEDLKVPNQTDIHICGYYIMRFMKEIVEDKELSFASKWGKNGARQYSTDEIDAVRGEWAEYVYRMP